MAIKIVPEVVQTLATEQIMQNTKAFAQGTGGAITPVTDYHKGDFLEEIFFKSLGGVQRRDPNSTADAVAETLSTGENVSVKLYYKKVVEYKLTDIKRYGANPDSVSVKIGQSVGDAITAFMLNKGILAAAAAIQAGNAVADTSDHTLAYKDLLAGLKLFGDRFNDIKSWVMNSTGFFGLMQSGMDSGVQDVASGVLYNATPATMNRKVYVTDSPSLDAGKDADGNPLIWTLGLTPGAVVIRESEEREMVTDIVSGKENLIARVQVEGAITVSVKGYAYKTTAGINPDDATLGAAANWAMSASDVKATAGIGIKSKA